jgi:hypothetical protein
MPGQVLALQRRIELLLPEQQRYVRELAAATEEAKAQSKPGGDAREAERALKRAARLRTEAAAVNREVETLNSLVAARLSQSARPRWMR